MNLHAIARGAVSSIARERRFLLYRSAGNQYDETLEERVPVFKPAVEVLGQMQSVGADQLVQSDRINLTSVVRKVYLFVDKDPMTMRRALARSGDYLVEENSTEWYIDAVLEDFSHAGWLCVQVIQQQVPVNFKVLDDAE